MLRIYSGDEYSDSRDRKKSSFKKRLLFFSLGVSSLYFAYTPISVEVSKLEPSYSSIKKQTLENISSISSIKEKASKYLDLNLEAKLEKYSTDLNFISWANASLIPEFILENKNTITEKKVTLSDNSSTPKTFDKKNKNEYKVIWSTKLDVDKVGNLDYLKGVDIYKLGNGLITYNNGTTKEISSENLTNFLLSSLLNAEEMRALQIKDLITDNEVIATWKKVPNYISNLKDAMIAKQIYTHDLMGKNGEIVVEGTYRVLDPKFKRFKNQIN